MADTSTQTFDFDEVIDRHGTGSLKYDTAEAHGISPDAIPLWVADMDFRTPPCVIEALCRRACHGIFGYTTATDGYFEALIDWWQRRYGWRIDRKWCMITPGVVYALAVAVRALSEPGDAVIIQQPVYHPFREVVTGSGRRLANAPLVYDRECGRYSVDIGAFERAVEQEQPALFLLCNPHNPVGRAWTAGELRAMGEICLAHGVTVVSDEIHADFARPGHVHVPFAGLGDRFQEASVICTSVSKTFNLAGLQNSAIVIADPNKRARFAAADAAVGHGGPNVFGPVAAEAAYRGGEPWLEALKAYLEGNIACVREALAATPLRLVEPETTYLLWIDCRDLGLSDDDLQELVERRAGLWVNMGHIFGPEGSGFIRVNIACPHAVLEEAMGRLVSVVA